jgi:hypothetical protein
VIFSCIKKNRQLNAAERRVYISTKKFIKFEMGDLKSCPPKIFTEKMVKFSERNQWLKSSFWNSALMAQKCEK